MPTPLDILQSPVSLTVLAIYAALIGWKPCFPLDRCHGCRAGGPAPCWSSRCTSSCLPYLPLLWDETLAPVQLSTWSR